MSTTTTSTRSCESDDSLTDIEDEWCSVSADELEDLEQSRMKLLFVECCAPIA